MVKATKRAKQEKEQIKEEKKMQNPEFGFEKVGREYVDFMRNSFRTWMESATLMQDQGTRLLDLILKQGQTGYDETSKTVREWTHNYKKALEQFQNTVEDNFTKIEESLSKKD